MRSFRPHQATYLRTCVRIARTTCRASVLDAPRWCGRWHLPRRNAAALATSVRTETPCSILLPRAASSQRRSLLGALQDQEEGFRSLGRGELGWPSLAWRAGTNLQRVPAQLVDSLQGLVFPHEVDLFGLRGKVQFEGALFAIQLVVFLESNFVSSDDDSDAIEFPCRRLFTTLLRGHDGPRPGQFFQLLGNVAFLGNHHCHGTEARRDHQPL